MARLVLVVFVVFMLLTVLRGLRIFFNAFLRNTGGAERPGKIRNAEMIRDPVCGTWIDRGLAVPARRGGESVLVCARCRKTLEAAG